MCTGRGAEGIFEKIVIRSGSKVLTRIKKLLMYLNVLSELYGMCSIEQVINLYVRDGGSKKELFEVISFCEATPENKKVF